MAQNTNKNEKVSTRLLPTKFVLMIRILVGAYLVYTAYELIDGVVNGAGRDKYFLGIFMVAFTIIGILLMIFAGRDMLRGRYVGGEMDACDDESSETIVDAEVSAEEIEAEEYKTEENEKKEDNF